jgi:hypothetical protein
MVYALPECMLLEVVFDAAEELLLFLTGEAFWSVTH